MWLGPSKLIQMYSGNRVFSGVHLAEWSIRRTIFYRANGEFKRQRHAEESYLLNHSSSTV